MSDGFTRKEKRDIVAVANAILDDKRKDDEERGYITFGIDLDRLRELAEAERDGRVAIRPDCAVCKLRIATEGHPNCGYEQSCSGKKRASFFEPLAAADAQFSTTEGGQP